MYHNYYSNFVDATIELSSLLVAQLIIRIAQCFVYITIDFPSLLY
jgi:hypothetical protein